MAPDYLTESVCFTVVNENSPIRSHYPMGDIYPIRLHKWRHPRIHQQYIAVEYPAFKSRGMTFEYDNAMADMGEYRQKSEKGDAFGHILHYGFKKRIRNDRKI